MDALLEEACWAGDAGQVARLLASGADVHANNDAALRTACAEGHAAVASLLLHAAGANVHANDDDALRTACAAGHASTVELLLDAGADVHANDGVALRAACSNGHVRVAHLLLDAGAAVNTPSVHTYDSAQAWDRGYNRERRTPLASASAGAHVALVARLLAAGADAHANRSSALCGAAIAASNDAVQVMNMLLNAGADPHETYEALDEACELGHAAVVERFLQAGLQAGVGFYATLELACAEGHLEIVNLVLAAGADLEDDDGCALIAAALGGHQAVVDRLLAAGADPLESLRAQFGAQTPDDMTWRHLPFVKLRCLLRAPAETYHTDRQPEDVLQYAAAIGDSGAVEHALAAGADVHDDGGLALRLACWGGHLAIVRRLLAAGADANAYDDDALQQAASNGHVEVMDVLVVNGANPRNSYKGLYMTCSAGQQAALEWLLAAGADVHLSRGDPSEALIYAAAFSRHPKTFESLVSHLRRTGMSLQATKAAIMNSCMVGNSNVVRQLLGDGATADGAALDCAIRSGSGDVLHELLGAAGAHVVNAIDDWVVRDAAEVGRLEIVAQLLQAGYRPSQQFWRDLHKAGVVRRLLFAVPHASFQALPNFVRPLWMLFNVRFRHRLHQSLMRARDRLDRPPREPLGDAQPRRDRMIAHLRTAGRRFAREYWTDGLPIFFPNAGFGPVPDCFLFRISRPQAE